MENTVPKVAPLDGSIYLPTEEYFTDVLARLKKIGVSYSEVNQFVKSFNSYTSCDPKSDFYKDLLINEIEEYFFFDSGEFSTEEIGESRDYSVFNLESSEGEVSLGTLPAKYICDQSHTCNQTQAKIASPIAPTASKPYYIVGSKVYDQYPTNVPGVVHTMIPLLGGVKKKMKQTKRYNTRPRKPAGQLISQIGDERGLVVPNPAVTVFFRQEVNITTDAAGKFTIYGSLRSVIQSYNNANPFDRAPEYARLYDMYRPDSIKLYMTLQAPMVQATGRIGTSVDYDHVPPSSFTIDDLADSALYREHRNVGTIDVYLPLKKRIITAGEYTPNGADPSIAIIHKGGYLDFATPVTNGTWFMAGDNLPVSSRVGTLIISMMAKCRDSRTVQAAADRRLRNNKIIKEVVGESLPDKKMKRRTN